MFKKANQVDSLVIHYFRSDAQYKSWALWLWEFPNGQGKQYDFNGKDSYGVTLTIKLSTWSNNIVSNNLGLIIKTAESWNKKDGGNDKKIKFSKLNKDKQGNYHVYLRNDDPNVYVNSELDNVDPFAFANFIDFSHFEFKTNSPIIGYKIYENDKVILTEKFDNEQSYVSCELKKNISLDNSYKVEATFSKNKSVFNEPFSFRKLFKSEKFIKDFTYNGELGAIIDGDKTSFKVWSPVSKKIILRVYKEGTPKSYDSKIGNDEILYEVDMKKAKNGVFGATIAKNLHGLYYTYVVTNDNFENREIIDIYAKSSGINGLRGMIVDFSKTNPKGFDEIKVHDINPRHLTVYEAHIADITSSKTWTNNPVFRKLEKTFLGACLEGTTYYDGGLFVKTGFDHIKELGVNAVQLLPVFDSANDEANMSYNWGYNPVNYNVIEGGYSTNPFDGFSRIYEFKELIRKYNEAGINIIMDVVYNHVNGAPGSNFDVLMPGYYFRYNEDGSLSNGSGCGNETASEMPMMRKLMIDSVCFLAKEYKLGGFRFDLMALHDMETMNELVVSLHKINKSIIVYGEPWGAACTPLPYELSAVKDNGNKFEGYGFFNDTFRDALIRESCARIYSGWCENDFSDSNRDQENIANGIRGICLSVNDPNKILNYTSCHDNRTLYDKIVNSGITDEKEIKRIALLANSIALTSNGISFILSGEEFLRTKRGCENSYNAPYDINELDYSRKIKHLNVFKNYQKLVALKQVASGLALDKGDNLKLNVDISEPNIIHYEFDDKNTNRHYVIYHLNGLKTGKPYIVNLNDYNLYLDTINSNKELSIHTSLIAYETLIAWRKM